MSLLEVSVWEPFGEKHLLCVKPDVRVAERIHKKSAEYEERRYSEIGWYRDSHRPLFYDRRTVFFISQETSCRISSIWKGES